MLLPPALLLLLTLRAVGSARRLALEWGEPVLVDTVGAPGAPPNGPVRAVTFSFLCPLFEKYGTFIALDVTH
eukprot:SAG31_NODE_16873_length_692_cov_0.959528_2_plen_72_part_00